MFDFWLDSVQKRRFFFFVATLPSQKIVKEIAYILTCYQALLRAHFFYSFNTEIACNEFPLNCFKANKSCIEDA